MSELIQYKCTNCYRMYADTEKNPWTCPFCGYVYTTQTLKEQTMSDNVWTDDMRATCRRMQREDFLKSKRYFTEEEYKVMMETPSSRRMILHGEGSGWQPGAYFLYHDSFYRISPDFVPPAPPKPEPTKPEPLTAKDVPAGAMYRENNWREGCRNNITVEPTGVSVHWTGRAEPTHYPYEKLARDDNHEMWLNHGDVRKWRK